MLDYFEGMRYDRLERRHDDDLKCFDFDDEEEDVDCFEWSTIDFYYDN